MRRSLLFPFVCALYLVAGCTPSGDTAGGAEKAGVSQIDGYGPIKFGSSFTATIGELGHSRFNPSGVADCFSNMATDGCFLSPAEETSFYEMKDGIPYSLQLDFSKYDKLFQVSLRYEREGTITRDNCRDVFERTLDWVRREYGDLTPIYNTRDTYTTRRTAGGFQYKLGTGANGFFAAFTERKFEGRRRVAPHAVFIVVDGKRICRIDVDFTDAELGSVLNEGRVPD